MCPRLTDLLFEGETVREEIDLSRGTVAVTSHRVLALVGEGDDQYFAHADLPNVREVDVETTGDLRYVEWAVRSGVLGVLLLGGGVLLQTNEMFQTLTQAQVADTPATAGLDQLVSTVAAWLSLLNMLLVFAGLLAVAGGLGLVGLYLNTRDRELVVEVADRDSIRVPVDEAEGNRAVSQLKGTL